MLENPQHQQQLPPQSPPIPTHARNLFPESLQNRQFNSSQILNDESCSNSIIEEDRQQHVGDVQRSPTISNRSSPGELYVSETSKIYPLLVTPIFRRSCRYSLFNRHLIIRSQFFH